MCTSPAVEKSFEIREASDNSESSNQASDGESLAFGPSMVVERKEEVELKLRDNGLSVGIVEGVDSGSLEYKIGADGLGKQVNGGLGQNLFGGGPSGSKNIASHATNLNQGI
ncbi:hypothetical protein Goshw_027871 [Gossypium schwendimanii]|uniref:Uncharacterized protein n=1 Tax=Gossypium schwendimanii TaxID=34291 RepID=A0A7J9KZH1_GOSSC|nr:hypothetical protein [Gossypium schwendimanii]